MKSLLALFGTLMALTLVDLALARRGRGQCPSTEGMMGICVESCTTDADCQGDNKCCSNGCGHACMAPTEGRGGNGCKYSKGDWSACDAASNTMTRTNTLRRGGQECEATTTTTKPCREGRGDQCKYKKGPWGECDAATNTKSRTLTLKKGDAATCEATKTVDRPCNAGGNADKAKRRKNGKRRNKEKSFRCHYTLTNSTQCDDVTNTRSMTLTLKKGLPSICEQSKTISKPCRERSANGCTYGEPQVSDCVDNQKTITKTLTSGDPALCEETKSKTKPCGGAGGRNREAKKAKRNRRRQKKQEGTI